MKKLMKKKKFLVSLWVCVAVLVATTCAAGAALAKDKHINADMKVKEIEDTVLYQNVFPLDAAGDVILPPPSDPSALPGYLQAHPDFDLEQFLADPAAYWEQYLLQHTAWWRVVGRTVSGDLKGKLKGDWAFTYNALVNPLQAGTIAGTLEIITKKGTITAEVVGTTSTVLDEWGWPKYGFDKKKGRYLEVFFSGELSTEEMITCLEGTGKYATITGTLSFDVARKPIRLYVDEDNHVTGAEGKMKLELVIYKTKKGKK